MTDELLIGLGSAGLILYIGFMISFAWQAGKDFYKWMRK